MTEHPPLVDQPDPRPVLESSLEFDGAIFGVRSDRLEVAGSKVRRDYVEHPGAVAVLALDEAGRVLVIRQYRHPVQARTWELPAGLLDIAGEDPLTAAQRELAEETDLVAAAWEPLTSFHTSPGASNEKVTVFLATGLSAAGVAHEREAEEAEIETAWVELSDLVDACLTGAVDNPILRVAVLTHAVRSAR